MNQKNSWVVCLVIFVLCNSCAVLKFNTSIAFAFESQPQGQILPIAAKTEIQGQIIELEVAETAIQQATGLMFRESLPDNRGMLFSFERPRITNFWMKNVTIPLDMIFLRDGEVMAIFSSVPPCPRSYGEDCPVYGSNIAIDQVIELRGGRAKELGLKVGDRITINFLDQSN
jgi:hypothetical protein